MRRHWGPWARGLAGGLLALLGVTFAAPPVAAAEARPVRLAATVEAKLAALDTAAAVAPQAAPAPPATTESRPFLKTPKGMLSIVLMAGATAWLIQSRIDNKVSSPGRK